MPKQTKTRRPYRSALAALAAALAVLLALTLFRLFGWPRGQFTFTPTAGEAAAWQGFTLYAAVDAAWSAGGPQLVFRLQDGEGRTCRTQQPAEGAGYAYAGANTALTLPEDARALDAQALESETSATGGALGLHRTWYGHAYRVESDRLQLTETLYFYRGTTPVGSLRLDLGEVEAGEHTALYAYRYEPGAPENLSRDYLCTDATRAELVADESADFGVELLPGTMDSPVFVARPLPGSPLRCGLYLATELLSKAEVAALPAEATVGGAPMPSLSAPYGAAELLCPLDADEAVCGLFPLDGGGRALLTQLAAGEFRLYLFGADWQLQSEQTLDIRQQAGADYALPQRLRGDEIALQLENGDLWVLRTAGGRLAQSACLPGTALPQDENDPWAAAAGLNEQGTALLTAHTATHSETALQRSPDAQDLPPVTARVMDGYTLRVWQGGQCTAAAELAVNVQANRRGALWGNVDQLHAWLPAPEEIAALRLHFE